MALPKPFSNMSTGANTPPAQKRKESFSWSNLGKNKWFIATLFIVTTILVTIMLDIIFFKEGQMIIESIGYWISIVAIATLCGIYIAQDKGDISILGKLCLSVAILAILLAITNGVNPEFNPRDKIQSLSKYFLTKDIYGGPIKQYRDNVYSFTLDSGEVLDHWITLPPNTGEYTSYAQSETNRFEMILMTSDGPKIFNVAEMLQRGEEIPSYNPLQLKLRALEKQVIVFTVERS